MKKLSYFLSSKSKVLKKRKQARLSMLQKSKSIHALDFVSGDQFKHIDKKDIDYKTREAMLAGLYKL